MIPTCRLPLATLLLLFCSAPALALAQAQAQESGEGDRPGTALHLTAQERAAIAATLARGRAWLRSRQDEEGVVRPVRRGDACPVAMTAMALWALAGSEEPLEIESGVRAVRFLLRFRQDDGGIYDPSRGLAVYTSGVAAAALRAWHEHHPQAGIAAVLPDLDVFVYRAGSPESLVDVEQRTGTSAPASDARARALLDEADGLSAAERAALGFISRCRQDETRKPLRMRDPRWRRPGASLEEFSYEDILPLLYLPTKPEHQRAIRSLRAIRAYYTVDRNPDLTKRYGKEGFQQWDQGLYYYYFVLAKTLAIHAVPYIETAGGERRDWVRELSIKLMRLQLPDGEWANANGSWWEDEPVLATSYATLTLARCYSMRETPQVR